MNNYFILFANCIPVKGYARSVVCDVQTNTFEFIPNELFQIVTEFKENTLQEIIQNFGKEHESIINEYFNYLEEKDFGFWNPTLIPELTPISLEWQSPQRITNALIDVKKESTLPYHKINKELDELGCAALELRFSYDIRIHELDCVLSFFEKSTLRSIDLFLIYSEELTDDSLSKLFKKHSRVFNVNIAEAPFSKDIFLVNKTVFINFVEEKIEPSVCCGIVNPTYFRINIDHFTESVSKNNCLNRKVSIDGDGHIKNCPSLPVSYGNINEMTLNEAIEKKGFKDTWSITKDQIETCKDCEFRYICTDCRAFTEDTSTIYAKPLKCNYNPYTTKWND
ncbi:hypothetical protein IMCC3317_42170 [Kordia antarctica]|uniref:4Fe4S-binding SPASM domain-containing protein n=1 Tax=Kordia antarctica TaxID=1218801 RepID=A0A7L4ZQQ8_9FLAO|nr:grasp-with-spasm system SPASM domain peptide maturase [Kordia antarctica]QHI38817.1 hypothetical protein IMCC3317_42170 [Kordia antarctica]